MTSARPAKRARTDWGVDDVHDFPKDGTLYVLESVTDGGDDVLRTQCQAYRADNVRCTEKTSYDYRMCSEHLLMCRHLVVAPSRIAGAGMGLFAVDPSKLPVGYDMCTAPPRKAHVVVFRHNHTIGGAGCTFAGETIDDQEFDVRYGDQLGEYVLDMGGEHGFMHDESTARTCLSYANDAIDVRDALLRRNFVHETGRYTLWAAVDWPHVVNARSSQARVGGGIQCLKAIGPIAHGDEILWSYSGAHDASRLSNNVWTTGENNIVVDAYWHGRLHGGGGDLGAPSDT